jgi:Putative adhesin
MPTYVRTQEVEHDIGEGGSFSLRVTRADTELRAIDGGTVKLRATFELRAASDADADGMFDRVRLRVIRSSDRFEADEPREDASPIAGLGRLFGSGGDVHQMRVEAGVPRHAELHFSGVSADAVAIGFAGPQQYQTVSGDLVLTDVAGGLLVKSVSGDVSIRASGPVDLEASAVSGDLSVSAPQLERLVATSVSGDIEVDGALAAGGSHRVETVSGDLGLGLAGDVTLEVRGLSTDVDIALPHRTEGSRDRRRYVIGNGGPLLTFGSMSGDVSVRASRRAPIAVPPTVPAATATTTGTDVDVDDDLDVLRALERGEIGVDEAARRLRGES